MSVMLPEILRWQKPLRPARTAPRWRNWAQSLTERHGRIAARHEALALTWLQPVARIYDQSRRWQNVFNRFCPQIHLAVAPLLRETFWKEAARPSAHEFRVAPARVYQQLASNGKAAAREQVVFMNQPARGAREKLSPVSHAPASWAPLHLVFERMNETINNTHSQRQSLLVQESLQTLRRVQQTTQRVEERTPPSAMVKRQPPERMLAEVKPAISESPAQVNSQTNPWPQPNGTPAINLEHLTEQVMRQIDRRMVIWRERTGRV